MPSDSGTKPRVSISSPSRSTLGARRSTELLGASNCSICPAHPAWSALAAREGAARPLREPVAHWSRLALPVPDARGCNARAWRLIA